MPRKGKSFNGRYAWRMNPLRTSSHTRFGPEYQAWRDAVIYRDKHQCVKCGKKKFLKVHHIKKWADAPMLRFSVLNGITLCHKCHKEMFQNEEAFEKMCYALLASAKVRMAMGKAMEEEKIKEGRSLDDMDKIVDIVMKGME